VPFSKCASGTGIVWSVRPGKACAGVIIPGVFRPNILFKPYRLTVFIRIAIWGLIDQRLLRDWALERQRYGHWLVASHHCGPTQWY
jgi:hypothetical protein